MEDKALTQAERALSEQYWVLTRPTWLIERHLLWQIARSLGSPAAQSLNNLAACSPSPVATEAKRSPSTRVAPG